jgi:hypothetical protein
MDGDALGSREAILLIALTVIIIRSEAFRFRLANECKCVYAVQLQVRKAEYIRGAISHRLGRK